MRTIALEEHFTTPAFLKGPGRYFHESALKLGGASAARTFEQLADVGAARLAEMDAAGIDVQVLSLNFPGTEQAEAAEAVSVAHEANAFLAEAVAKHPTRFIGLAALPTGAPDKAAAELETCVRRHGFKGAIVNGHNRGRYLDDHFYSPILECAEALNASIYLHPTLPPKAVIDAYYGGFAPGLAFLLSGPGWGWHIETAVHLIRLVVGGVFDRFPKLQVVIGHMGEGLPFMMPRLERTARALPFMQSGSRQDAPGSTAALQRPLGDYLRQNVHYTFGAFNFLSTFLNLLLEVGVDRIMFSTDYPYGSMTEARSFLDQIPVSAADRARIAHGNAEKLFQL
jgi:uncharacterized protein